MPGKAAETYQLGDKRKQGHKENILGKKPGLLSLCCGCGGKGDELVIVARPPELQRKHSCLDLCSSRCCAMGWMQKREKGQDDPTGSNQNRHVETGLLLFSLLQV